MRILGIDPGSRTTGYAVIAQKGRSWVHVENGILSPSAKLPMAQRLAAIYAGLLQVVMLHAPKAMAIEQVFLDQNPQTAIKLGQARGIALLVAAQHNLEIAEYTPRAVKQAVAGYGESSKSQIQEMVKRQFSLPEAPCEDAADALAIAFTHALIGTSPLSKDRLNALLAKTSRPAPRGELRP